MGNKKNNQRSLVKCVENIQDFANRFKLIFEDEGECGFGRDCVGLLRNECWVNYNPMHAETYEYIEGFYDERFSDIAPEDAYHKHDCLAVLGRGEDAIRQLSDWVDKLNELGVVIDRFETGATGMQALFSGTHSYAIRIPDSV